MVTELKALAVYRSKTLIIDLNALAREFKSKATGQKTLVTVNLEGLI